MSKKINFNKHWWSWAKWFFLLAEQWLLNLLSKRNLWKISINTGQKNNRKQFSLRDGHMIIASIWNIKHGIELLIKALWININKEYLKKHNLDSLINNLEIKINNLCIKNHFNILKKIVEKYYKCTFWIPNCNDLNNEIFKYPESEISNNPKTLDYSFVHKLTRKDINKFIRDIHNLIRIFEILEWQPSRFDQAKRLGFTYQETKKQLMRVRTIQNLWIR